MNERGEIYELQGVPPDQRDTPERDVDEARLEGYLAGRIEKLLETELAEVGVSPVERRHAALRASREALAAAGDGRARRAGLKAG